MPEHSNNSSSFLYFSIFFIFIFHVPNFIYLLLFRGWLIRCIISFYNNFVKSLKKKKGQWTACACGLPYCAFKKKIKNSNTVRRWRHLPVASWNSSITGRSVCLAQKWYHHPFKNKLVFFSRAIPCGNTFSRSSDKHTDENLGVGGGEFLIDSCNPN